MTRDPRVVSLTYELAPSDRVEFVQPPPLPWSNSVADFELRDGILTCVLKQDYSTEVEAILAVKPALREWGALVRTRRTSLPSQVPVSTLRDQAARSASRGRGRCGRVERNCERYGERIRDLDHQASASRVPECAHRVHARRTGAGDVGAVSTVRGGTPEACSRLRGLNLGAELGAAGKERGGSGRRSYCTSTTACSRCGATYPRIAGRASRSARRPGSSGRLRRRRPHGCLLLCAVPPSKLGATRLVRRLRH